MRILTFDLEEWFHCDVISDDGNWDAYSPRFERNLARILETLQRRSLRATFFCLGWIARRYPRAIQELRTLGHEVECHSDMHRLIHELGRERFRADTERAVKTLEDLVGCKVRAYRAPAFSLRADSVWAIDELARVGIEVDSSVFPAEREYGGFKESGVEKPCIVERAGVRLREFPINVGRMAGWPFVFSGGGYFRLFPFAFVRRCTRRSDYLMAYFHPRDFDPDQPVLDHLPLHRRWRSYYGLGSAFAKFERWLDEFQFMSLGQAEAMIDWKSAPIVRFAG